MNKQLTDIMQKESFAVLSRALAAIIGGYVLTNLSAILLSYLLPSQSSSNVMTGMVVSYAIYAGIVIWVYSVKSLQHVWRCLLITITICAVITSLLMPEGIF
ncbi:MAG: hypothetical protein JKX67_11855 [Colwellia sp.]|nr:hypothetical protein [Colwellia sp.]